MKNSLVESVVYSPIKILGVTLHPLTIAQLNGLIAQAVEGGQKWIIAHQNLHGIYLVHRHPSMQAFYKKAKYTHIDGMSLVLLGKFLGFSLEKQQRVTYADWMHPLMAEAADRGWRVFYLGSKPGVAAKGAAILREKFPNLQIETADGYFDASSSSSNLDILTKINKYNPHVLMVGMSMPRQENWIENNLDQIFANAILPCGAAIDYVAGVVPTPPRWTGKIGLEWLFRLIVEPKRLWQRYLVEPWFLLQLLLIDIKENCKSRWRKR